MSDATPQNMFRTAKPEKLCESCEKRNDDAMKCSKCQRVWYCNKECQLKDWAVHKTLCSKMVTYNIEFDERMNATASIVNDDIQKKKYITFTTGIEANNTATVFTGMIEESIVSHFPPESRVSTKILGVPVIQIAEGTAQHTYTSRCIRNDPIIRFIGGRCRIFSIADSMHFRLDFETHLTDVNTKVVLSSKVLFSEKGALYTENLSKTTVQIYDVPFITEFSADEKVSLGFIRANGLKDYSGIFSELIGYNVICVAAMSSEEDLNSYDTPYDWTLSKSESEYIDKIASTQSFGTKTEAFPTEKRVREE